MKTIHVTLQADRFYLWHAGFDAGLDGDALNNFTDELKNVELTLSVDIVTGKSKIISVDNRMVSGRPYEI